jgi:RHS repeat-associated protein
VSAAYVYTPYGELLGSSGAADNPYTWQGRFGVMREGASGLYYARARYYDSRTGRFLSRDPVGSLDPRGINPYQYAYASPLGYVDPLGLTPQPVEIGPAEAAYRARLAEYRAREAEAQARSEERARQRQEEKNREGTEVREQRMRSIRETVRTKLATRTRTTTTRGGSGSESGGGSDTGGGSEGGGGDPRDLATGSCPIRPAPHGRTGPRPSRPDPTTEALLAGGASVATNFAGGPIPTDVLGAQEEGTRLVIGLCDRREREEELLGVSGRRELRQGEGYWGDIARSAGEYTIVQLFLLPFGE